MLVSTVRGTDGNVDRISISPESFEEVILLNTVMEDRVNFKRGLELLIKEAVVKGRGIKKSREEEHHT